MAMLTNKRILHGTIAPNHVYCGILGGFYNFFWDGVCVPSYVLDCGLFQTIRPAGILYRKETIYSELVLVINL